ncbi:MAG: HK97 family phage prohead protease [Acidimicrobiales bacterium]|jgi:HK97 family phage prohead protease
MRTTETRVLPGCEVRDIDTRRHEVEARICCYGVSDHHGSVWATGVFNRSLARSTPIVCMHHDLSRPIGRVTEYRDSPSALDVTIKLADTSAVPDAATAWSLLTDGVLREWSTTFERRNGGTTSVPPDQRSAFGELPAREIIHDAELVEVSAVTAASVPGTSVLAMRGRFGLRDLDDELERLLGRVELRIAVHRAGEHVESERRSRVLAQAIAAERGASDPGSLAQLRRVEQRLRVASVI